MKRILGEIAIHDTRAPGAGVFLNRTAFVNLSCENGVCTVGNTLGRTKLKFLQLTRSLIIKYGLTGKFLSWN
jgi:hypothetical protein